MSTALTLVMVFFFGLLLGGFIMFWYWVLMLKSATGRHYVFEQMSKNNSEEWSSHCYYCRLRAPHVKGEPSP